MSWPGWLLFASTALPLVAATRANFRTSLIHSIAWAWLAWLGWAAALAIGGVYGYLALCLTGCAGVAVLGARWPGAAAWNFVVASLLVVLLLPLAEASLTGTPLYLGIFRTSFLLVLLGVIVTNYLPTSLGAGALFLVFGCLTLLVEIRGTEQETIPAVAWLFCAAGLAWMGGRQRWPKRSTLDQRWLAFRDRYGAVWAQRVRDQFNRAAANAGWKGYLRWSGLCAGPDDVAPREQMEEVLIALMKRFSLETGSWTSTTRSATHRR